MSIIKVTKTKDYTVMNNSHLRNKSMSLKAKGLLSVMLSLPENWDYSVAGLVAICKEGRDTIMNTLTELKQFGYLVVDKIMPDKTESGRIEYIYNIYEEPIGKQDTRKQDTEKQPLVFPTQLNTNQLNTKESITKEYNMGKSKRFVPPTLEEVRDYCDSRHNSVDPEYFIAYYTARDWVLTNGKKVKDWKSCVITWEKNNNKFASGNKAKPTYQTKQKQEVEDDEDDWLVQLTKQSNQ